MRLFFVLLLASLLLLQASPAHAYVPHNGDRAAPLSGRDLKTDSELRLEDLRGKWVLLDFWHMNCPSCLRELPLVSEAAKPYVDAGTLEVVLVSLDEPETAAAMKKFVAGLPVTPHVIYSGKRPVPIGPPALVDPDWDSYAPQATEWSISGVPASYLISPDGTIAAKRIRRDNAPAMLGYFIGRGEPYVPIALRTSASANGKLQVTVLIEAASASHEPLQARISYRLEHVEYRDYEGSLFQDRSTIEFTDWITSELCLMFDEFSDATQPYSIDASGYQGLQYRVEVLLPGSERYQDGTGLWLRQYGSLDFALDWLGGESSG
jgi:thiol-disulfide isomerase/thioredoxin